MQTMFKSETFGILALRTTPTCTDNTDYTYNILRGKGALLIFLLYIQRVLVLCFILRT